MEKHKPWSYIRKRLEDSLCDCLKGKIQYFYTSYHEVHNAYSRAAIRYNGKEILIMTQQNEWRKESDVCDWSKQNPRETNRYLDAIMDHYYEAIESLTPIWNEEGKFCAADLIIEATRYFQTDVRDAFNSSNYLFRMLAVMDKRIGKRTLQKIKDEGEYKKLPYWLRQFYEIRLINEFSKHQI